MLQDRIRGSFIGGAIGDALGYPVEKMTLQETRAKYGYAGITQLDVGGNGKAFFSNETQMALFTANALLYGDTRFCVRGIEPRHNELIFDAHVEWEWLYEAQHPKGQHTCWIRDIAALKNVERGYVFDKGLRLSPIGLWVAASVARGGTGTYESVLNMHMTVASALLTGTFLLCICLCFYFVYVTTMRKCL